VNCFAGASFEEDVVWDNDRGAAVLLQNGKDVLEKVELFVSRARPEIVAMNDERLFLFFPRFVYDCDAALFPERWISENDFVFAVFPREPSFTITGTCVASEPIRRSTSFMQQSRATLSTSSPPRSSSVFRNVSCVYRACCCSG
jgi:hypothetical protein